MPHSNILYKGTVPRRQHWTWEVEKGWEVARDVGTSTASGGSPPKASRIRKLLDDARKEAVGRYRGESTLAIGEVAYLVGCSEPAPSREVKGL